MKKYYKNTAAAQVAHSSCLLFYDKESLLLKEQAQAVLAVPFTNKFLCILSTLLSRQKYNRLYIIQTFILIS